MNASVATPPVLSNGQREGAALPAPLQGLTDADRLALVTELEKLAWLRASRVADLSGYERSVVSEAHKRGGQQVARRVRDRLYRRHHWDSLRWFLWGGYLDIKGLVSDPRRSWDPKTNPYVKVFVPGFTYTKDEHDDVDPFKRLPDKDYLRYLAYAWVMRDLLAVPKSRQLMVSWLFCSIICHNTLSRPAQRTAIVSKKEEDADALIDRIKISYDLLPHGRLFVPHMDRIKNRATVESQSSSVMAMNESAKGLRSFTFSAVLSDETAFQAENDEVLTAAMATVRGGGRLTCVSTMNGQEVFFGLVTDNGKVAFPKGR